MSHSSLFTLLAVLLTLVHVSANWSWSSPTRRGVYLPSQFGVHNFKLAGPVKLIDGREVVLEAVVYAKAIIQGEKLTIRAHAWFVDPASLRGDTTFVSMTEKVNNFESVPKFMIRPKRTSMMVDDTCDTSPCVLLKPTQYNTTSPFVEPRTNISSQLFEFNHGRYQLWHVPYVVQGTGNITQVLENGGEYYFCIDKWLGCALFPLGSENLLPLAKVDNENTVVSVIKPVHGMTAARAATLIYYQISYHQKVGFKGAVLYERGTYLDDLRNIDSISKLIETDRLSVMVWVAETSGFDPPIRIHDSHSLWGVWDITVVYAHAALSFWGTNTFLFFNDLDEFLALPEGTTFFQLQNNGCLKDLLYLEFYRKDYGCAGDFDPEAFEEHGPAALKQYRSCSILFQGNIPKCIAHADAISYFVIHNGFVFDEFLDRSSIINPDCAYVVHLANLIKNRFVMPGDGTQNTTWLWPFNSLQTKPSDHQ